MSKLRIGFVGTGFIFKFHYDGFKKLDNAQVSGCYRDFHGSEEEVAKQKKGLEELCRQYNMKPYYSYEELVKSPDIDALVIGSINPYHYDQIMQALDNGKHMLVEKPVVTDVALVEKIRQKQKSAKLVVFPGHNFVYRDAVIKAKEIIDSGKLGKIVYSSLTATQMLMQEHASGWRSKEKLSSGGALMDSGHHLVYMSLFLRGMPEKIHAFQSNTVHKNMEGEDIAQVNIVYPDGSLGCIMQSWASNYCDGTNGIRIVGDKGRLLITDGLYFNSDKISSDVDYGDSFCNQAKYFVNCIVNNKEPLSNLDDVKNALRLIYAAYESSKKNKIIRFNAK